MKNNTLIYILSLILLAICIVLLQYAPESNRASTVAGLVCAVGLALNLFVFFRKEKN
ncbi:hypothetical protein SAMN06265375_105126 [Muriicola jejuensis]|nr:hypothetical protein SAMN06265375_105126 [Muriicola jejuensis]